MAVHASSPPQNQMVVGCLIRNCKPTSSSSKLPKSDMADSKDGNVLDVTSCVSSAEDVTNSVKECDINHGSLTMDHGPLITETSIPYPWSSYYGSYFLGESSSFLMYFVHLNCIIFV